MFAGLPPAPPELDEPLLALPELDELLLELPELDALLELLELEDVAHTLLVHAAPPGQVMSPQLTCPPHSSEIDPQL